MSNFGKEALTPYTQLTFTCFLKKRFLTASSYIRDRREYLVVFLSLIIIIINIVNIKKNLTSDITNFTCFLKCVLVS